MTQDSIRRSMAQYDVREEVLVLETSEIEDTRSRFIIRNGEHSAIAEIRCLPTLNPHVPRKYHTLRSRVVSCCNESLSGFNEYIYRVINANLKAGDWIDGSCDHFVPNDNSEITCDESLEFLHSSSFPDNEEDKAVDTHLRATYRNSGNGNGRGKGTGTGTGKNLFGGGGEVTARNYLTAKDQAISQKIQNNIEEAIEELFIEDGNPKPTVEPHNTLATYLQERRLIDDGTEFEKILWDNANAIEKKGRKVEKEAKESAWTDRHMFSASRTYRRANNLDISNDPDIEVEAQKTRWENGSDFLNQVVNRLHAYRGALALVVYRAARRKLLRFYNVATASAERRKAIAESVAEGLRFTRIYAGKNSHVILPSAHLASIRNIGYSNVCQSLKLEGLIHIRFTQLELAPSRWEIPLSSIIQRGGNSERFRIVKKNGVEFWTDSLPIQVATELDDLQHTEDRGQVTENERPTDDPQSGGDQGEGTIPGTAQEVSVSPGRSVLGFTPVNGVRNMRVLHPEETISEPQSNLGQDSRKKRYGDGNPPDRASEKRPRLGRNGASQNGHTDLHPGDPRHTLPSPPPSQSQSRPSDQVHALNYNNTNLFVDAGDGAANLQETRMFTPINAGHDGGPTTSPPDNTSAVSRPPRWEVMGLTPRTPSTARVHPSSSAPTVHDVRSSNNIQIHSESTPEGAMASNEQVSTDVPSGQPGNWTGMGSVQAHPNSRALVGTNSMAEGTNSQEIAMFPVVTAGRDSSLETSIPVNALLTFDSSGEAATLRSPNILLEAARVLDPAMLSAPTGQDSRFWEPVVDFIASVGGSEGSARQSVDTTAGTSDDCQADEELPLEFSDLVDWNCASTGADMAEIL